MGETDDKSKILASGINEQTITEKESKNQDDLGLVKVESAEENKMSVDSQAKEVTDISSKASKKPKKKAQRSDAELSKRIEEISCTKSIKDEENNINKDNANKFIE